MKIRTLTADEIDVRGQSVSKGGSGKIGVVLLLYKDARVDMKILDETFGICGWQRSHEVIDGNLYCTIKIRSEEGEWISKQDVGVESNTEKEKGQASDSFKRAAFNIGIGRELYTSPFVWVELDDKEYSQKDDKYKMSSWIKFYVMDIKYSEDNIITDLVIVDKNGKVRYSLKSPVVTKTQPTKAETTTTKKEPPTEGLKPSARSQALYNIAISKGITVASVVSSVRKNFNKSMDEMTADEYEKVRSTYDSMLAKIPATQANGKNSSEYIGASE